MNYTTANRSNHKDVKPLVCRSCLKRKMKVASWIVFFVFGPAVFFDASAVQIDSRADVILRSNSKVIHKVSEDLLTEMTQVERFKGVALVMRGNSVIHARAYGNATREKANKLNTAFHVGSITKQFTAAAIMQLVEKGSLVLDNPISGYLPEKYRSDFWSDVRLHHLLSHTSGIPDYAVTREYYDITDGWALGDTVDGMIREAMQQELEFKPGTDFEYSNIGYTLLGEIIEEQTGSLFEDYIQENLLDPLGMTKSRIRVENHVPLAHEASGFRWNEAEKRHTKDNVVSLPVTSPDGGLVTTLNDFTKWITIYRDKKHPRLSSASLERMLQPSIPADSYDWPEEGLHGNTSYGFGLTLSGDLISHPGIIVGFTSHFIYDRQTDLLVAVFTNNKTTDAIKIASDLFKIHDLHE